MVVAASCGGDVSLNIQTKYRAILYINLFQAAKQLRLTFQQDHTEYTARATMEWFRTKHIYVGMAQSKFRPRSSSHKCSPVSMRLSYFMNGQKRKPLLRK
ncbi:hypothetical protein ATANTOWER_001772 [Ataeniobius toweri]|uniref:Uncharacterized protein n=1 Tax=Ataeniobius toweri TaxID=208326 RepID=A0ABU7A4P6_9TELE|nr:hypothetical protein [Ataeniobius toweri]